jgi:hypothetical protein
VDVAYQSLLAGWSDYLAHDNAGRPIVFIGHSQGAAMLIRLLQSQVDPNPTLRRRLVSAIILGGNVTVPATAGATGSFSHLPACRSAAQFGCVLAYSSFPAQPPADSFFGRPGQGVSSQSGQTAAAEVRVLCVNPAAVAGGTGPLDPYFPTVTAAPPGPPISTPWVEYPALYTAACRQAGGANWLNVTAVASASDHRPRIQQIGGARWGFHVGDVNLALGNLVDDVRLQEASYRAAQTG